MTELKACPFCGSTYVFYGDNNGSSCVKCQNCDAIANSADDWNTRPIEGALQAENERLREALKKIADATYTKFVTNGAQVIMKIAQEVLG